MTADDRPPTAEILLTGKISGGQRSAVGGHLPGVKDMAKTLPTTTLPIDPNDMAKAYDSKLFEEPIYDWWESQGYFKPEIAGP
ncbi:MAG: hypothetical protein HYR94_30145, partial [Chloroflexi bacterium]|nr:hypothetical protein [Chloroflexota bacterium]